MTKKHLIYTALFFITLLASQCREDSIGDSELDIHLVETINFAIGDNGIESLTQPLSNDFSEIPQDPNNPLTIFKVELGKFLYHETACGISPKVVNGTKTYSCSSCHSANAGFQAGTLQGLGEGGIGYGINGERREINPNYPLDSIDLQPIRTPTVLNGAYQSIMLWNGQFGATGLNIGTESEWTAGTPKEKNNLGFEGLETQAIAGLTVHRMGIDSNLLMSVTYKSLFDDAFPDIPVTERYTKTTMGLAIAAYERTVLSNKAPFQEWLKGDYSALTAAQKRGAIVFFSKGNCYQCHNGPALSSEAFYALGMKDLEGPGVYGTASDDAEKLGRGGFTKRNEDMYKFKVPQLYNLTDSPFYGHGGSFTSIKAIIEYKNNALSENNIVPPSQLSNHFTPLNLNEREVSDLIDFIENGLYDPDLVRYEPSVLPSGLCFPNNDVPSKIDRGCAY